MNKARWDAVRAKRDADLPERIRNLAEIDAQNLPRKQGDVLGYLQWTDLATGQTRRWIVRIGDRIDRITVQSPQSKPTPSMGWSAFLTKLRKHITNKP
jgi:hypothetical protein